MTFLRLLALWLLLLTSPWAIAQNMVHQGPGLLVRVQRGDQVLPLALVDHLRAGDRLLVQPEPDTLAPGDWVLMLATVSPTGSPLVARHFSVRDLHEAAELEITGAQQLPVIFLAPQLRNLFGLYTSLSESASLLEKVLQADPQRFVELSRVDQINQAIQALSQSLQRSMRERSPQQAMETARNLAYRFGVRQIDPECFKNQLVNTECVALQIVANKDFVLPGASDLSALVGDRKAVDFNSFLLANLRVFSQASDYLSNKYRDSYDFAPTFGRRQPQGARVDLYAISRFRSGSVKTAYIYVPSWFESPMPRLSVPARVAGGCFSRGQLPLQISGRLPFMNPWHSWQMRVSDAHSGEWLDSLDSSHGALVFDPESAVLSFKPSGAWPRWPTGEVEVELQAQFGFEALPVMRLRMGLPWRDDLGAAPAVLGLGDLVAGESAQLSLQADAPGSACVEDMALLGPDGQVLAANSTPQARLQVNLERVGAGPLQLQLLQASAPALALPVRALPARAHIERIEHADGDEHLTLYGRNLQRIARVQLPGQGECQAPPVQTESASTALALHCSRDVPAPAAWPTKVRVLHRDDEPGPIELPLAALPAVPRVGLASDSPNPVLVHPSDKALQWRLPLNSPLMSEDSGLSLLLRALPPYTLAKGQYLVQLRFADDPITDARPLSAPLMADFTHNELRTRAPLRFETAQLPGVVNALEYRVVHSPTGQASAWQSLGRQVVWLPELRSSQCVPDRAGLWVAGQRLELIEALADTGASDSPQWLAPQLETCPQGVCLYLPDRQVSAPLELRLRWLDTQTFKVQLPPPPRSCP